MKKLRKSAIENTKVIVLYIVLVLIVGGCSQKINYVELVNPLIDTHKSRWFFFSSASRPFGMVNLSPDTQTMGTWNSGYLYDRDTVRCFSHIHAWQLSGIPVLPTTGSGHDGFGR